MRRRSSVGWECIHCGVVLLVPRDTRPEAILVIGAKPPPQWVVRIGSTVVHRCSVDRPGRPVGTS